MKDLTIVKQGKATAVQDRSGKCLTEERQILNRWTEYRSKLHNHKANEYPPVLNCPQTNTEDDHPVLRKKVEACSTIIEEKEVSWSQQHPGKIDPRRWRVCNYRSYDNLQQENGQPLGPSP